MILDEFQKKAIQYAKQGFSVFVCAPTGAGKTLIAEEVIRDTLQRNQKVVYTAPIKALSNQKFRDFSSKFGSQNVGILTGDVSINSQAPLVIMTTEIFRNVLIQHLFRLTDISWVIFDEIHYLDDIERGSVWEESLIFLPSHMNFLALSATVPNIKELVEWTESIHHRPVKLVWEDRRPVPLKFYFQYNNTIFSSLKKIENSFYFIKNPKPNKVISLIKYLKEREHLPCIYFSFSRKKCEDLAWEMRRFDFLDKQESKKITDFYKKLLRRFNIEQEKSSQDLWMLIKKGIAFHHAGLLPQLKEVIEILFTNKMLKLIFTTETFALGVNMPARSVCFDELVKFYGRYTRFLKTRDFYQMAGRSGRRGIDKEGFVYVRVNPHHITLENIKNIIYGKYEKVNSQFNLSYATILNLYQDLKEKILDIYPMSFYYYQNRQRKAQQTFQLLKNKLALLQNMGYIYKNNLTPKGRFSSNLFGYELILGELFEEGYLEKLSFIDLNILISSIVFEPRKSDRLPKFDRRLVKMSNHLQKVIKYIHKIEKSFNIWPRTKRPFFHIARSVELWSKGRNFQDALKACSVDEGELIRYLRMTIQVLREIKNSNITEDFRKTVNRSLRVLNRNIVDAQTQLLE